MTAHPHHAPGGVLLFAVIVLAVLYVSWRTGLLRRLRGRTRLQNLRADLRESRISPFALLPLAVLVIVIVVLLITH